MGEALARRLAARGDEAIALRRSAVSLAGGIRSVSADLSRPQSLSVIPAGIQAVAYTAAADASDEPSYRKAYVEGLKALLELFAARDEAPPRFLFSSSTSVYGQSAGEWVDEDSPTRPQGFRGDVLLEGESLLASAPGACCAVRFGGIYGPGRTRLLRGVADGSISLPSQRPYFTNRIHRDDAAGVLEHLLDLPAPAPRYVAVDDEPADLFDVVSWLGDRLGVEVKSGASSQASLGRGPGHKRCRNELLRSSGYRFQYPSYREGYESLMREL